jgi:hypothetical protein
MILLLACLLPIRSASPIDIPAEFRRAVLTPEAPGRLSGGEARESDARRSGVVACSLSDLQDPPEMAKPLSPLRELSSRTIARIPEGATEGVSPRSPVFSRDGTAVAYYTSFADRSPRYRVYVGDAFQGSGDRVSPPRISDDGKTVAYGLQNKGRWIVVSGGKKSEEYDGLREIALSRDGRRLAVVARFGDKWSLVVDGVRGESFDAVEKPTFSADGSVVAYLAGTGKRDNDFLGLFQGTWTVVVNGKRCEEFKEVRDLVLSRDGKRVAFSARKGAKQIAVVDGKAGQEVDNVSYLAFSGDGSTFGYAATDGRKAWPVVNGERVGPGFGGVGHIAFGTDGNTLAYMACDSYALQYSSGLSKDYIVFKGRKARSPFAAVEQFAPSPDGSALFVSTGDSIAVGDLVAGPFMGTGPPCFSEDGKTVSVGVREEDAFVWKTFPLK